MRPDRRTPPAAAPPCGLQALHQHPRRPLFLLRHEHVLSQPVQTRARVPLPPQGPLIRLTRRRRPLARIYSKILCILVFKNVYLPNPLG